MDKAALRASLLILIFHQRSNTRTSHLLSSLRIFHQRSVAPNDSIFRLSENSSIQRIFCACRHLQSLEQRFIYEAPRSAIIVLKHPPAVLFSYHFFLRQSFKITDEIIFRSFSPDDTAWISKQTIKIGHLLYKQPAKHHLPISLSAFSTVVRLHSPFLLRFYRYKKITASIHLTYHLPVIKLFLFFVKSDASPPRFHYPWTTPHIHDQTIFKNLTCFSFLHTALEFFRSLLLLDAVILAFQPLYIKILFFLSTAHVFLQTSSSHQGWRGTPDNPSYPKSALPFTTNKHVYIRYGITRFKERSWSI